jgi:rhamnosyltransferase
MNVFGILVAYQPNMISLIENLTIILPQVDRLLIINNGSESLNAIHHSKDVNKWTHWQLRKNETNEGISRSYNRGIREAIREKAKYVVFFDQDSRIDSAMIPTLIAEYNILEKDGISVAGVGPWYQLAGTKERAHVYVMERFFRKKYPDYGKSKDALEEVSFLISSGTLFSTDTIMTVGCMDENLFVDHVDTDWFIRAAKKGFRTFVSRRTTMLHQLGSSTFRFPFTSRVVPIHSADRYRENFKNTIYLYRKHFDQVGWIISDLNRFFGLMVIHVFRLDLRSLFQSLIGVIEGFRMSINRESLRVE